MAAMSARYGGGYQRERSWVLAGNHGGEQGIRAEPFEAVELNLEVLWLPSP